MVYNQYRFATVPEHSVGRRAIGFLEEEGNPSLNAKSVFDYLEIAQERDVRKKFDYWLDFGINDRWFHGWPNDHEVKECFSFRWDEKRHHHRFYGFLWHPQPKTNPRFHICVLVYHDVKNDENTDRTLLLRSMKFRSDIMVRMAINFVFLDEKIEKKELIQ